MDTMQYTTTYLKILLIVSSCISISQSQTFQKPYIRTPYGMTEGSSYDITCTSIAIGENVTISWQRTNPLSSIAASTTCSFTNVASTWNCASTITLSPRREDEGVTLTCTATQVVGGVTTTQIDTSNLVVWVSPPTQYPEITGPTVVSENVPTNWTCVVDGSKPRADLIWRVGASNASPATIVAPEVTNADGTTRVENTLTLTLTSSDNNLQIHCDMYHSTIQASPGYIRKTTILTVNYVPKITTPVTEYTVQEPVAAILECSIDSMPIPTIVMWFKDFKPIIRNTPGKYIGGDSFGNPNLEIRDTQKDDAGSYVCSATNAVGSANGTAITLTVQYVPVVTITGSQYTVSRYDTLTIPCTVDAVPQATGVRWFRTTNGITNSVDVINSAGKYGGSIVSDPSLTIYNAQPADTGQYQCLADSTEGTGQSIFVDVTVNYPPRYITIVPASVVANESETISATCSSEGVPPPDYNWYLENSDIIYSTGATLTITNIQRADDAVYQCVASNSEGNATVLVNIDVRYAPVLTVSPTPQEVIEGGSLSLECSIDANPSPYTITWQKNGVDVDRTSPRISGGTDVNSPNLTFTNILSVDEGAYRCIVDNFVGRTVSAPTIVSVTFEPRNVIILPSTDVILNQGEAQTLMCSADGDPAPTYAWKDGSDVIATGGSLVIASAGADDNRQVTCEATNSAGTSSATKMVTVFYTPIVTIPGGSAFGANEGNSLSIPCLVDSHPDNDTFHWLKDSVVLDLTNSSKYGGGTRISRNLTIFSLGSSDAGNYSCQSENMIGLATSREVIVTISYKPETAQVSPMTVDVSESEDILVTCSANGAPSPTYSWYKNDVKIQDGAILNVTSVGPEHAGIYKCEATNDKGTASVSISVSVKYSPRITSSVTEISEDLGNDVTIPMDISANPEIDAITWFMLVNGTETALNLTDSSKYEGGTTSVPSLTIKNVESSDAAKYRGQATNSLGTSMGPYVEVVLSSSPTAVTFSPVAVTANKGETIQVTCSSDGAPTPNYVWYRNGVEYSQGAQLIILSASEEDTANYTCRATNAEGTSESTIEVDVMYRPEGYTDLQPVTTTIGNPATLTCTNRANPPATSYEWSFNGVTLSETTANLEVTPTNTSFFGTYTCRATNTMGTSDPIPVVLQQQSTNPPGTGASTANAGLSTPIIILLILLIIILLIIIIVVIVICYKKGKCRRKKNEPKVAPKPVTDTAPAPYEKPEPIANTGMRSPHGSTISKSDVHVNVNQNGKPIRIDEDKYANGTMDNKPTDGGTIISIPTSAQPVPHHLPPMEASTEKKKKRRKKKKKRHHDEENPQDNTIKEDEEEE